VYKSHHVAIALHFCNKSSSDFISAIQQNLIRRGPRSGSKKPRRGILVIRQPCKRCSAYRSNRSVSFFIRRRCFACALTVTTKRGSRACVTRWLLALARIILLPRPERARVVLEPYLSSRCCPSTMRGVSLLRTLRLRVYHEVPLCYLLPSLPPSSIITCLNVSASLQWRKVYSCKKITFIKRKNKREKKI